jgi:protein-L-isoaspartate(D-aspartate) O-methyltransferase
MKSKNQLSYLNFKLVFLFLLYSSAACSQQQNYDIQRKEMVEEQIKVRGIINKIVVNALLKVERHLFVPPEHIGRAYGDHPLPIGYGQTISQPYIVAFMTEVVCNKKARKVLEIGTGSGYQAAVLAEVCDSVYTIEILEQLGAKAQKLLRTLGYKNVFVKIGDGYKGWLEHAPYDAIIVTCAPTHIPQPLKDQLTEGGCLIIPVGPRDYQELVIVTKKNNKFIMEKEFPVRFVPMIDKENKIY